MRREIPAPVMAVCSEIISILETHASLDNLFTYAGAPGEPPVGSKPVKALSWLRATNLDQSKDPLRVLGRILEPLMERPSPPAWLAAADEHWDKAKERMIRVLAENQLAYMPGGIITHNLGVSTKTLADFIRSKDFTAIEHEFNRALENVEAKPREAVSAASNILESVCKVLIEDEGLELPSKQDIQGLWGVVRKYLGLDPSVLQDKDLQQILTGIISVVSGIGALRTHASSAHGEGRRSYRLEPRHARLAIHSAHTVALFILESWQKRGIST